MKTSQTFKLMALGVVLATVQVACSPKISADLPSLIGPPADNKPVAGMDVKTLNGTWTSGCYIEGEQATSTTVVLKDGSFTSTANQYFSTSCVPEDLTYTYQENGQWLILSESKTEPGSFHIEMDIAEQDYTEISNDLIKVDGNNLYFGDAASTPDGDFPSKTDLSRPYTKQP